MSEEIFYILNVHSIFIISPICSTARHTRMHTLPHAHIHVHHATGVQMRERTQRTPVHLLLKVSNNFQTET